MSIPRGCQVAIVGAGLAGLATAAALSRHGHTVNVYERMPELSEIGAGINMYPNANRILKKWGLFDKVEALGIRYDHGALLSYRDGTTLSTVEYPEQTEAVYGSPDFVIHRVDLHKSLVDWARECGAKIHLGSDINGVRTEVDTKPAVTFADGTVAEADVVLCADGERSVLRKTFSGEGPTIHDSGDHVFRTTVPLDEVGAHEDLAHLLDSQVKRCWLGPGGNALMYPLRRDNLLNIVLTQEHTPTEGMPQIVPQPVARQAVLDQYQGWDPFLLRVLALGHEYAQWTLLRSDVISNWITSNGCIALIGDAAHAIPPFLGQGACMAFEDAAVLDVVFSHVAKGATIEDALRVYQDVRQPRMLKMREHSYRMRNVYAMPDGAEQQKRDMDMLTGKAFDGHPLFLLDPTIMDWMYNYDAFKDTEEAWEKHKRS